MDSLKPSIDAFYDSAPTSPTSRNFNNTWFYSLPPSPTRDVSKATYNIQTESRIPETYFEDANSNFDEFEFETSLLLDLEGDEEHSLDNHREHHQQSKVQRQHGGSLSAMAFADDLFCEGKVLPLKLPPRLHYPNDCVSSNPTSPKSFHSMIKFGSFWSDDFDPFMVALENVKKEKRGKSEKKSYRRAQSMSPMLPLPTTPEKPNGLVRDLKLTEPKGVGYARRARELAKAEADERPIRPTIEGGKQKSKRKRIMKLIKRSFSMAKTSDGEKKAAAKSTKPKLSKEFSSEPMGSVDHNKDKRRSDDMTGMAIVQWRPKLFLCMGYAPKYVD